VIRALRLLIEAPFFPFGAGPFDDQTQDRIRLESEAVILVIEHCHRGEWRWLSSNVVNYEVAKSPFPTRRERVQRIVEFAETLGPAAAEDINRGKQLEGHGFSAYDALHVACAERGRADVLLTTDDRFVRLGKRHSSELKVRIENPLTWLQEVL
jgi:predicted nucleic acid-binding protein